MSKLHVDSVIKSFGTKQVLTDVFMTCTKGEIVGILGRNGSGKSTLLKIIFGSLKAEYKFVKVGDKQIKGLYDGRRLINYLPQESFLPNHLRMRAIVNLFCRKENAAIIFENEFFKPLLNRKSKDLSGGEKRIVEIFLIIYSDAEYILIDEPFNGVAPVFKEEIKNLIKEQSRNKGFVITDHDYRNILDIATKTVLLHDGGTKLISDRNELKFWNYLPEAAE